MHCSADILSHRILDVFHKVAHHPVVTISLGLFIVTLMYDLKSPDGIVTRVINPVSDVADENIALTCLDDPRYNHEYVRRTQYINAQLEGLRTTTRADLVYVVSYEYDLVRFGNMVKISKTFEIGQIDGAAVSITAGFLVPVEQLVSSEGGTG